MCDACVHSEWFICTKPSIHIVASELNDPICHSNECQIGSFSSEATISCHWPYSNDIVLYAWSMITYLSVLAMHLKKHIKILISSRSSDNKSWSHDPCIPCPGRGPVWNVSFSTPDQTGTLHYRWSLHAQSADESKHSVSTPWRSQDTYCLTLSGLNLSFSSSSTTSRELLSQFSTCSGWRWFDVVGKL